VREWILHKRGSEVLTEKVENIGKIKQSKKNTADQNLGFLPPLPTERMEFTMANKHNTTPEPRKGQGLRHVSEFIDELLGEILG
jgi:hypothetical protein